MVHERLDIWLHISYLACTFLTLIESYDYLKLMTTQCFNVYFLTTKRFH